MAERLNPRDLRACGNAGAHNNARATACFAKERYREGIEVRSQDGHRQSRHAHRTSRAPHQFGPRRRNGRGQSSVAKTAAAVVHFSRTLIKETAVWTREDDYRKYIEAFSMAGLE
jgi:hypothetical protein